MKIKELIADRGYGSAENLKNLDDRKIETNIPLWSSSSGDTFFKEIASGFKTDQQNNTAHCPEGHEMKFSTVDHTGRRTLFVLSRRICMKCPRAETCLSPYELKNRGKRFAVPDNFEIFAETNAKQEKPYFKKKLKERMWKMEGIFAEAKSFHGLRRARYRGRSKMQIQVYMVSTVQNLKRLASRLPELSGRLFSKIISYILLTQNLVPKAQFCF